MAKKNRLGWNLPEGKCPCAICGKPVDWVDSPSMVLDGEERSVCSGCADDPRSEARYYLGQDADDEIMALPASRKGDTAIRRYLPH